MTTFLSDLRSLDASDAELVIERAAIVEYCGNLPRAVAECLAMAELESGGTCNDNGSGTVPHVQGGREHVA